MKKHIFKSLALSILPAVALSAAVDVSQSITSIGNPNGTRFNSAGRANTPWAMQAFDGVVFVGYGDYDYNAGPIPAWKWVPSENKWVSEGNLADEQIAFFYEFSDGNLYSPGIDDHGNYTLTGHVFRRLKGNTTWEQNVYTVSAQGQHNFSMAEYPTGRLWTAGYGICYADNYGNGVASGGWNKANIDSTHFSLPANESSADGIRLYPFVPFSNGLIVGLGYNYNDSTHRVNYVNGVQYFWQYNESENKWYRQEIPFATLYPSFNASQSGDYFTSYGNTACLPGKALVFKGKTYYNIVSRFSDYLNGVPWGGLWSATMSNGQISAQRLAAFPVGDAPVDFFVRDDRLYTLSVTSNGGTPVWHIRRSVNGTDFTELYTWSSQNLYRSFAYEAGHIYLGVWTKERWSNSAFNNISEPYSNGTILRFEAPLVERPVAISDPVVTVSTGSITVSVGLSEVLSATDVQIKVNSEITLSATGITADCVKSTTVNGLRTGTYPVEVRVVAGEVEKVFNLEAVVTKSAFLELGEAYAEVANDGKSAALCLEVLNIPTPPASFELTFNSEAQSPWQTSVEGVQSRTVSVKPGTTNQYSFVAQCAGQSVVVAGSFVATVYTNWFTVDFADAGYKSGKGWTDTSSVTSPGGVWAKEDGDEVSLDASDRMLHFDTFSAYSYTPYDRSEQGSDVEVHGRCKVSGAYVLQPVSDVTESVAAISFLRMEDEDFATIVLWNGREWVSTGLPPLENDTMVDWCVKMDFASESAPRVRVTVAENTSKWIPILDSTATSLSNILYMGQGVIGSFSGDFYSRHVHTVLEIPVPVFGGGSASQDGGVVVDVQSNVFSVSIANAIAGAYYTPFTSETLEGPWLAEKASVMVSADGALTLSVSADTPSKFLKVVASDVPFAIGDELPSGN